MSFSLSRQSLAQRRTLPAGQASPAVGIADPEAAEQKDALAALQAAAPPARFEIMRLATVERETAAEYAQDICKLWTEAQRSFVAIGRSLANAKARLTHGDFMKMVESDLPFGPSLAYQFRMVAEMVDSERVAERELPNNATTAYLLATLKVPDLEAARRDGLVRANLKRQEVIEWKRGRALQSISADSAHLIRERERLQRRLAALEDERERLMSELARLGGHAVIEGSVENEKADEND